jgi:hypothetical protein
MNAFFNKNARILAVSCILLFLLAPMIHDGVADTSSGTVVRIEPQSGFVPVGETFSINITIANVQNLYGIEVTLVWNSSILQVISTNASLGVEAHPGGALHEPVVNYQDQVFQDLGKYTLAGSSTSPAPSFNGTGTIATVTFNVVESGSCTLGLETVLASNIIPPGGISVEPIPHETINGVFGPFSISVSRTTITLGDTITINGSTAEANATVGIQYRHDDETEWHPLGNVTTDERGSYTYKWKPEMSGNYSVRSSAVVEGSEETSSTISVSVKEPGQPLLLYMGILAIIIAVALAVLVMRLRRNTRKQRSVAAKTKLNPSG